MNKMYGTAVIKNRGQLIIPEKKEAVDWEKIWLNIDLSRSYKGKKGNLTSFIVTDRQIH